MAASLLRLHFHDCFVNVLQNACSMINGASNSSESSSLYIFLNTYMAVAHAGYYLIMSSDGTNSLGLLCVGLRCFHIAGRHRHGDRREDGSSQQQQCPGVRSHRRDKECGRGCMPCHSLMRRHPRDRSQRFGRLGTHPIQIIMTIYRIIIGSLL